MNVLVCVSYILNLLVLSSGMDVTSVALPEASSYQQVETLGAVEIRQYPERYLLEFKESSSIERHQLPGERVTEDLITIQPLSNFLMMKGDSKKSSRYILKSALAPEVEQSLLQAGVLIRKLPAQTVAVLQYPGSAVRTVTMEKIVALLLALDQSSWQTTGEPLRLVYHDSASLEVFQHHEVVVPVSRGTVY